MEAIDSAIYKENILICSTKASHTVQKSKGTWGCPICIEKPHIYTAFHLQTPLSKISQRLSLCPFVTPVLVDLLF